MIRILSYNLLVHYPSWNGRPVGPRIEGVHQLISELKPDVMCLQEVDRPWALALKNFSSYRFVQPHKVMTHMYMTTLMYNTKTMELIEGDSIPFQHGLLKRNRRITYGVFRIRSTHQKIIVVSTHLSLVFNDDPRYLKTMSMQASQLYDTVNTLVRQYGCPVVIGGDFNCVPDIPLSQTRDANIIYKQLASHFIDASGACLDQSRDHIFIMGSILIDTYKHLVLDELKPLSDHYPLYIDAHIPT